MRFMKLMGLRGDCIHAFEVQIREKDLWLLNILLLIYGTQSGYTSLSFLLRGNLLKLSARDINLLENFLFNNLWNLFYSVH